MKNTKRAKWLGILGITLCGLCCALPIIGATIAMASLTIVAFYLEKLGLAAIALALISLLFVWYNRRPKRMTQQQNSCSIDCDCKTESSEIMQINK